MSRIAFALAIVLASMVFFLPGCTPATNDLVWAASTGNLPRVKEMVAKVDVNARAFDDGETALIGAARNGHLDVIEFLLAHGADINRQDAGGTPLFWAAFTGQKDAFDYLRTRGARLDANEDSMAHLLRILRADGRNDLIPLVQAIADQESGGSPISRRLAQ
jgi:ankyrin repeat protein